MPTPPFKEDLLHYVWRTQRFTMEGFSTTDGQPVQVINPGMLNRAAGPDFASAQIVIGSARWAGAVECHLRSSDWMRHGHSPDPAYAGVVLHVVWQHDEEITLPGQPMPLPVVELYGRIAPSVLEAYRNLILNHHPGPACVEQLAAVPELVRVAAQERALHQRLEAKAQAVLTILDACQGDWEQAAFVMLAQALGQPNNGQAMAELAQAIPLKALRRSLHQPHHAEALLLGQAGFLQDRAGETLEEAPTNPCLAEDAAHLALLTKEYSFGVAKHGLPPSLSPHLWQLGRMRPASHPALRLAQLATLISKEAGWLELFRLPAKQLMTRLQVEASPYWQRHFRPGTYTAEGRSKLGKQTAQHLIVNAVAPVLAAWALHRNAAGWLDQAAALLEALPPEDNNLTRPLATAGMANRNAAQSQALIGLMKGACSRQECLNCQVGHFLLREA